MSSFYLLILILLLSFNSELSAQQYIPEKSFDEMIQSAKFNEDDVRIIPVNKIKKCKYSFMIYISCIED